MVRYNFTLAVTRNTKKIAANELDLLLVLVRLLHNRKHKAASKPERPGIPASTCVCRQKQLYLTESYTREDFFSCVDAGYTQNEKPEFRLWHACHIISGYFFDESNTEQIIFTA